MSEHGSTTMGGMDEHEQAPTVDKGKGKAVEPMEEEEDTSDEETGAEDAVGRYSMIETIKQKD
jgi:hypothetical protein